MVCYSCWQGGAPKLREGRMVQGGGGEGKRTVSPIFSGNRRSLNLPELCEPWENNP